MHPTTTHRIGIVLVLAGLALVLFSGKLVPQYETRTVSAGTDRDTWFKFGITTPLSPHEASKRKWMIIGGGIVVSGLGAWMLLGRRNTV